MSQRTPRRALSATGQIPPAIDSRRWGILHFASSYVPPHTVLGGVAKVVAVHESGLGRGRRRAGGAFVALALIASSLVLSEASVVAQSSEKSAAARCVGSLGTLDAATSYLSGSGIIARDAGCVSSQRDPDGTGTFFARRHTFTLASASSVSFGHGGSGMTALLLQGSSSDGSGAVLGRGSASHLVLAAGTYTIEATTHYAERVGSYSVWVRRYDLTPCVGSLGTLDAATSSVRGSGIVARDAGCVSSQRDADGSGTFFARRHVFTLDVAATVSLSASSGSFPVHVVLLGGRSADGSGTVLGRDQAYRSGYSAGLNHLLLAAGTYTIEVTTSGAEATGPYSLSVNRWAAHMPLGAVLVEGDLVEVVYELDLDVPSVPPAGAFSVVVDGVSRSIKAVAGGVGWSGWCWRRGCWLHETSRSPTRRPRPPGRAGSRQPVVRRRRDLPTVRSQSFPTRRRSQPLSRP